MAEYYLISQLPSLDGIDDTAALPITEEYFFELCNRYLRKKVLDEIERLTLVPSVTPDKSTSDLINSWNDGERALRFALGYIRASKMNKHFDAPDIVLPTNLTKVADAAVKSENPLEAEKFLLHYRLSFLETLRPMDIFSEDYLYYYALKLKLILRIKQFDAALGEITYKNIYNSILYGNNSEA